MLIEGVDELLNSGALCRARREDRRLPIHVLPAAGPYCVGGLKGTAEVGDGALCQLVVIGFVYNQYIWDFHDAGLQELKNVAASWLYDEHDGVRHVNDVDLRLADSGRFDDDHVVGGGQDAHGRVGRVGKASDYAGRCE